MEKVHTFRGIILLYKKRNDPQPAFAASTVKGHFSELLISNILVTSLSAKWDTASSDKRSKLLYLHKEGKKYFRRNAAFRKELVLYMIQWGGSPLCL